MRVGGAARVGGVVRVGRFEGGKGHKGGRGHSAHHVCQSVMSECVDPLPCPIHLVGGIMVPED